MQQKAPSPEWVVSSLMLVVALVVSATALVLAGFLAAVLVLRHRR